ncbi:MAG: KH domain-containing protein [Acidimicrobiia bacterium]
MSEEGPDFDEGIEEDEFEDEVAAEGNRIVATRGEDQFEDEVGAEGNRIVGTRAKAVVEHVTRALADEPDMVDVDLQEKGGDEVFLLVHASPSDMGRLIGRRGRVIQAIRQVTRAAGALEGVKAGVDIAE